eukprot:jgi/Galph1/4778/GphlegSOOS_G3426.1
MEDWEEEQVVVRYSLDIRSGSWQIEPCRIAVAKSLFARGTFRLTRKVLLLEDCRYASLYCIKFLQQPHLNCDPTVYFLDVIIQSLAEGFAQEFNRVYQETKISFVPASVVQFFQRNEGQTYSQFAILEPFLVQMKNSFRKYNDNRGGFVSDSYSAEVANAFSHFTYALSGGDLVVCDIQGVGEYYTDPQVHTVQETPDFLETLLDLSGRCFSANSDSVSLESISQFISSHICNKVCFALGLQQLLPQQKPQTEDSVASEMSHPILTDSLTSNLVSSFMSSIQENRSSTACLEIIHRWLIRYKKSLYSLP